MIFLIFGIFSLKIQTKFKNFLPKFSKTFFYFQNLEKNFPENFPDVEFEIFSPVDFQNQKIQKFFQKISEEFSKFSEIFFWFEKFFPEFQKIQISDPKADFYQILIQFLKEIPNKKFSKQIFFEDISGNFSGNSNFSGNLIKKSKFSAKIFEIEKFWEFKNKIFEILEENPEIPLKVSHPEFLLEELKKNSVLNFFQTFFFGIFLVFFLVLIFFRKNLKLVFVSVFSLVSINLGVVGISGLFGVNLDFIFSICFLLSVGFSIDFVIHFSFFCDKFQSGTEAFFAMFFPMLKSSIITSVGVLILLAINSYLTQVFVISVLVLVILCLYHVLLIMPLLYDAIS